MYRYNEPSEGCEVCGFHVDNCVCPTCPECGAVGDYKCYIEHGLTRTREQHSVRSLSGFLEDFDATTLAQAGRSLYKYGFGAWLVAVLEDGEEVYYESEKARHTDWHFRCVGIRCGSIIEGADYDATPFTLMFPFTLSAWDKAYKALEDEVDYEWRLANECEEEADVFSD